MAIKKNGKHKISYLDTVKTSLELAKKQFLKNRFHDLLGVVYEDIQKSEKTSKVKKAALENFLKDK